MTAAHSPAKGICADAAPHDPHPAAGSSPRCAFHKKHYDLWRNKKAKALKRESSPYWEGHAPRKRYPPYKPRPRPTSVTDMQLDAKTAGRLRGTLDDFIAALNTAGQVNHRGGALRGMDLDKFLDTANKHVDALDRVLNPKRHLAGAAGTARGR